MGRYHGFPEIDDRGLKLANHSGGTPVENPLELDRRLLDDDRKPIEAFLAAHMPGVTTECTHHVVCMYTVSPDGHFIIDRLPNDPRIALVAGLSGHGFKCASVLGEIMADLACDGRTSLPIEFLGLDLTKRPGGYAGTAAGARRVAG